jgi:hypothetical protein
MKIRILKGPLQKAQVGLENNLPAITEQDALAQSLVPKAQEHPFISASRNLWGQESPGGSAISKGIIKSPCGPGMVYNDSLGTCIEYVPPKDRQKNAVQKGFIAKGVDKIYKGLADTQKFFRENKTGQKIAGISEGINLGSAIAAPILSNIDSNRRYKNAMNNFRQGSLPDNLYNPFQEEDRGDFDINSGVFRPDNLGFKSKGQYADPYSASMNYMEEGGENQDAMNTLTIRIVGGPQKMAYGGQTSDMALDLYPDQYHDMPEDLSSSVSSTLKPVPRKMANIEAEKGETVYGDLDGDGGKEHMKVGGKRHSEGGTPLSVPEGSFVFSDTAKMKIKDPEALKFFGLPAKKGGYTPAEIAKRYDVNKYKAILEDPHTDDIQKSTAQLMVKSFEKKLAYLAMVQESLKGFPNGVPQVAQEALGMDPMQQEQEQQGPPQQEGQMQYGGDLPEYQSRGQVKDDAIFTPDFQNILTGLQKENNLIYSPRMASGDNRVPLMQSRQKSGLYGDVQSSELEEFRKRHDWYFQNRQNWNPSSQKDVLDFQTRYDDEFAKDKGYSYFSGKRKFDRRDGFLGEYTYNAPGLNRNPKPQGPAKFICTPNGVMEFGAILASTPAGMMMASKGTYNTREEAEAACNKPKEEPINPNPLDAGAPPRKAPFDFMTPDKLNMLTASLYPPSMDLPVRQRAGFNPGRVTFKDWRSRAAELQGKYNTAANVMGTYGDAQGLASNLSNMAGQNAEQLIKAVDDVDTYNVDTENRFRQQEVQRKDQNDMMNATFNQQYHSGLSTAKQQFVNAKRAYANNMANTFGRAWLNRMNLDQLNTTNPYYFTDPWSGRSVFKGGKGVQQLMESANQVGSPAGGNWAQINQGFNEAKRQLPDLTLGQYMSMMGIKGGAMYTDSDMDGFPNSMRYAGRMMNPMTMPTPPPFYE